MSGRVPVRKTDGEPTCSAGVLLATWICRVAEVWVVTGHNELAEVYEWLIADAKAGSGRVRCVLR